MVAHASVKTPTALADLFLQAYKAQDALLDRACGRIGMAATRLVNREELRLKSLDARVQQSVQRRIGDMDRQVNAVQARIRLALTRKLGAQENALLRAAGRISRGLTGKYTQVARQRDAAAHRLQFAAASRISQEVSSLALKEARIKATDPRNILALGYVLVTGKDHQVLKTVDKVAVGDRIGVRFSDGALTAKVDEIYSETIDNKKVNIA